MGNKLLLTYSLLAHLKETSTDPSGSLMDLFVPIVQKAISNHFEKSNEVSFRGKNCSEIKKILEDDFGLDIPIPILIDILQRIATKIGDKEKFVVYNDGAYVIQSFVFADIDEDIEREFSDLNILYKDYQLFCQSANVEYNINELELFIRSQQIDLFTDKKEEYLNLDYHIPKYIRLKFEDEILFRIITKIYIGGILSDYFTLKITKPITDAELLLDTNFVISLANLNTEDSYNTCNQLYELCKRMGFKFSILDSTVTQIHWLLTSRIEEFSSKDSLGSIKENDIFAACLRRDISLSDLQLIRDKMLRTLQEWGIGIISDAQISTIIDEAKKSQRYKHLIKVRNNSKDSALNDAVAEFYVQKRRGDVRSINDFSDIKCWFLHNSQLSYDGENRSAEFKNRYTICADELLTMLWLTNPAQSGSISFNVIAKAGLSTYITRYRNMKRPVTSVIKEIKLRADGLKKYGAIEEKDIYNLSIRMSEGAISNETAKQWLQEDDPNFIKNVQELSLEETKMRELLSGQTETIKDLNQKVADMSDKIDKSNMQVEDLMYRLELKNYEKDCLEFVDAEIERISNKYFKYVLGYFIFLMTIVGLYVINKVIGNILPLWLATLIGTLSLLLPLFLRFVDHKQLWSMIKYVFSQSYKNAEKHRLRQQYIKAYEQEYPKPQKGH